MTDTRALRARIAKLSKRIGDGRDGRQETALLSRIRVQLMCELLRAEVAAEERRRKSRARRTTQPEQRVSL